VLLVVFPTLGRPWAAKVLATEALVGAAKTRGFPLCEPSLLCCSRPRASARTPYIWYDVLAT
jgi:hypothetical protein